jgi:hypothetical protein
LQTLGEGTESEREREGERREREREREGAIEKTFNSICMHAAAGYLTARPPALEIFPSWPMSHLQHPYSVSTGSI